MNRATIWLGCFRLLAFCLCLGAAGLLPSCSGATPDAERARAGDRPTIVATTGIIADAVKNLVGDKAEVVALMGPGVDPHLYKATQGDVDNLTSADLIVYNGLHLEG